MDMKEMKKSRKNLDILQVAAGDKENLTKKLAPKKNLSGNNRRNRLLNKGGKMEVCESQTSVGIKNQINKLKTDSSLKGKKNKMIIATDLTSDKPSENYWEKLAETRRLALESALKENENLHSKLNEMEYENTRLKEMLNEAQTLVEVLTEMLEGSKEDEKEEEEEGGGGGGEGEEKDGEDEKDEPHKNESVILEAGDDVESGNESFQSCI